MIDNDIHYRALDLVNLHQYAVTKTYRLSKTWGETLEMDYYTCVFVCMQIF